MSGHEHTNRCYWDYLECRWECRPALDEAVDAAEATEEAPVLAAAAAESSG